MKTFDFQDFPRDIQDILHLIPNLEINGDKAEFKVLPIPDPELGNMHVPLAQWLIKHGAKRGETVYIKNIE